jgi:hypothetical protein
MPAHSDPTHRDASGPEPRFPEAAMHLVRPKEPVAARVADTWLCTAGGSKAAGIVRHVSIDVSGTPLAGRFLVGQAFGVVPPGVDEEGRPHAVRLYSIASPSFGEDGAGHVLSTTVKRTIVERQPEREEDDPHDHRLFLGVASNYLCDLRIGDEVKVCGPQGKRFLLPLDRERHDYVFLATGTGIAPFWRPGTPTSTTTRRSRASRRRAPPTGAASTCTTSSREGATSSATSSSARTRSSTSAASPACSSASTANWPCAAPAPGT